MSKARVLMLTPYLPYPPVSGGRMRTYNLVKFLNVHYDITLVCFGRPEEREFDIAPMRELCELIVIDRAPSPGTLKAALMSLTSIKPITMRMYQTREMKRIVNELLTRYHFDIVHVESFYMLQNLPKSLHLPVLLSEPAIEYRAWGQHAHLAQPWFTRPGVAMEALKMRWWEPRAWAQADLVGAMSRIDAKIIQEAAPRAQTTLTPNGVDVHFFHPNPAIPRDNRMAVFMGDYKYFPNTDAVLYFAEEILPLIRAKCPDFRLVVLGKDPSPEISALAEKGVVVTGLVDDTRPYLQSSAVFICPLRSGSGTRFKLLEALACGCPVVSTSLGCEGLGAIDGIHMLIRDEPEDFAQAVLELLADPQRGQTMGTTGRAWVVDRHAWEHSAALVHAAYDQMVQARKRMS